MKNKTSTKYPKKRDEDSHKGFFVWLLDQPLFYLLALVLGFMAGDIITGVLGI